MKSSFKILHLEDVKADALLVEKALRKQNIVFENRVVDSREDFFAAVKTYAPDVILSDYALPSFNSMEALKIVHKNGLNVPFILVTSTTGKEFALNMMQQGADDYVLKDRLQKLPDVIINALKKKNHQSEKQRFLTEVKAQAGIASETLQKLSHRMIFTSETPKVGIWDWDIKQNILDWDNTMHSLNGMEPECFEGGFESWEKCIHPNDVMRVRGEMYRALVENQDFDTQFRVVWSDKSVHYIKVVGLIQRDEEGNAERMIGVTWELAPSEMPE